MSETFSEDEDIGVNRAVFGHAGRIERLAGWVQARLHEEITRDRVADELGMSPSHLSYVFRCVHGESFSCWLRRLRVEQAERLLAAGRLNVGEVSDACGFGSRRTLQRQFKETYGATPSAYRARGAS